MGDGSGEEEGKVTQRDSRFSLSPLLSESRVRVRLLRKTFSSRRSSPTLWSSGQGTKAPLRKKVRLHRAALGAPACLLISRFYSPPPSSFLAGSAPPSHSLPSSGAGFPLARRCPAACQRGCSPEVLLRAVGSETDAEESPPAHPGGAETPAGQGAACAPADPAGAACPCLLSSRAGIPCPSGAKLGATPAEQRLAADPLGPLLGDVLGHRGLFSGLQQQVRPREHVREHRGGGAGYGPPRQVRGRPVRGCPRAHRLVAPWHPCPCPEQLGSAGRFSGASRPIRSRNVPGEPLRHPPAQHRASRERVTQHR